MRGLAWSCVVTLVASCSDPGNFFPSLSEAAGAGGVSGAGAHGGAASGGLAGSNATGGFGAGTAGANGGGTAGGSDGNGGGAAVASGGVSGATGGSDASGGTSANGGSGNETGEAGEPGAGSTSVGGTAGASGAGATAGTLGSAGDGGQSAGGSGATAGLGAAGAAGAGGSAGGGGTGGAGCVPKAERCDGIDNDCSGAVDNGACPDTCQAKTFAEHVYLLCMSNQQAQRATYTQATNRCTQHADRPSVDVALELSRIESEDENEFVKAWIADLSPPDGMIWFGANDLDDERTWVYGRGREAVEFFTEKANGGGTPTMDRFNDFAPELPDSQGDCGAFDSEYSWRWSDASCTVARLGYLCEQMP
jgi:hypothetical protein